MASNDNRDSGSTGGGPREPDAFGQAALLLSESILHTLVDVGTLTATQAIATVDVAVEVKVELAEEMGESTRRLAESRALLTAIARSFAADRHGPPA